MATQLVELSLPKIINFCRKHSVLLASFTITGVALIGVKKYFAGGVCRSKANLCGKTVLITGANSGVGRETARNLAARGARVILACRDITKGERAAADIRGSTNNNNVLVRVVDLASLESVRRFCHQIEDTESRLDILVNNAGILGCPHWKSRDGHELQLAVNHLGHFLMTNLLLPLLKKSAPSRVINVTSGAYKGAVIDFSDINMEKNYNPWEAYRRSKLANILFTKELHRRLEGSGVSTFVVNPGIVLTNLTRYVLQGWKERLGRLMLWLVFKNSVQGAQTSVYCAVTEGLEKHSGKYFSDCRVTRLVGVAEDDELAKKLWERSAYKITQNMVVLPGHARYEDNAR